MLDYFRKEDLPYALKLARGVYAKGDDEHIGLGIAQWPQTIIVLAPVRIPKSKANLPVGPLIIQFNQSV